LIAEDSTTTIITTTKSQNRKAKIFDFFRLKSQESIYQCHDFANRLDIHAESAEFGLTIGLFYWSQLMTHGYEIPESTCGFAALAKDVKLYVTNRKQKQKLFQQQQKQQQQQNTASINTPNKHIITIDHIDESIRDYQAGVLGWIYSIDQHTSSALTNLALTLLHGLSLEALLSDSTIVDKLDDSLGLPAAVFSHRLTSSSASSSHSADTSRTTSQGFRNKLKLYLEKLYKSSEILSLPLNTTNHPSHTLHILAMGMLFLSALHRDAEAFVALSYRYEHGIDGFPIDIETTAQLLRYPVIVVRDHFQAIGAQAIVETHRIDDHTIRDVSHK
jgi:hypothetical protein